ncbi:MAG TPA: acyltransferase [Micromonospora sp.]|nr:acyltransferase [Micromonospora sp.]
MWKHRGALRDSGASGRFGRRGLPFLAFFGVALPLLAPLIDLMAVYGFFFLDRTSTLVGWLAMLGLQALTAVIAFRLDREPLRALSALPVQQFVYRQLMYLVLIQSMVTALTGSRLRWHKLQRTGQAAPGAAAPGAAAVTAGAAGPSAKPRTRDRWFDTLRAVALTRVFIYHMFPVAWLSFVFPAMGVMFAIGGSLMARSIDRGAVPAITNRIRRLLPALWVLAALLVPAMLWFDWPERPAWSELLTWVIPLAVPPGSPWAEPVSTVLWYLVTYLWLVLLSPALLWFYRRRPLPAVLLPLAVLVGLETVPSLLNPATASVAIDVATFGACWIVGFAHRDGTLRRLPLAALLTLAVLSLGIGAVWALTHPSTWGGFDLNAIPIGQAFYSLGFVLLLLRAAPAMAWLARARPLDRLVTVLNARAVTVYLWHNLAIAACFVVGNVFGVWRLGMVGYFVVAVAILVLIVLALGWVEDLAARRPARLLPPRDKVSTDAAPPDGDSPAPEPALPGRAGPSTAAPSN